MKQLLKNFALIFLILFIAAGLWGFTEYGSKKPEVVGVNRLVTEIQNNHISSIEISGSTVTATLNNPEETVLEVRKEPGQPFSELIQSYGVSSEQLASIDAKIVEQSGFIFWLGALAPYLLPVLLIIGLLYFMTRQMSGMNNKAMGFGQSGAKQADKDDKEKKTFADVAGAAEAKEELEEIVDFLKNPKKFSDMGAKIPKGVLLMGPPGTGKTLLAKAVAGEADVPFFHISGSEFVEMFVGVGASRVRDLFTKAKKAAPAIIFIDEIDAVGRKRGAGLGGGHDEREQTLNQILVEMDGFDPHIGVIVMAATNRPDVLDSALLRPGRFDRRVTIDKPDIKDREAILKVHASNKPLEKDVDLKNLAERTPGFTGADLANLLNEAAIFAVRKGKKIIEQLDVLESIEKVLLGPQKKSRVMSVKEKEMTAYHEAGHAVVGHFMTYADPVRKVSIIGRGMAGGYTLSMPSEEVNYKTIAMFKDEMAMAMGGYVAERMIYGHDHLTTGPSSDLKTATQHAKAMVLRYGMSDTLGPRTFGENEEMIFLAQEIHEKKNYSEKTAELIDTEIDALLAEARDRAETLLKEKRTQMDALVARLMEIETVEQEEFGQIMNG
ncbi:MAG: cell division protein FtsH [Candidatus Magasanikbacteria bacterium CG11_big_fil_rev_8_21_14_0_20_43_7]|uniref:ATP-dependent zinc metalloprotease FtsH n=1 Tax=Candidatus Magasanikbacteria bacterium CG11_big_fil_rev_8_21_14_0_20_43_7 TaxID=1974654 RepID=A0A2H0N1V1_9BACT|nr:MAG: cell division protein FtsH [Candidatus Magasanikbacteria bacterium CG11_big_fil_rev_8_21_14_0_20_43_7]